MGKLSNLMQLSIIKTTRINFHYFGIKGILKPKVICARNVKLKKLKGKFIIDENSKMLIGFTNAQPEPSKRKYTYFFNWGGTIHINGKVDICMGASLNIMKTGNLYLGNKFHLGPTSCISCASEISIGEDVSVSWDTIIMDNDGHFIYDKDSKKLLNDYKRIIIGNHCWIGCRSMILKGAIIPNNSILGAGSFLNKEMTSENTIIINDKIVKENIEFEWYRK